MNDLLYKDFDFVRSLSNGVREVNSIINMPFLALFGGNVEQSQPVFRNNGEVLKSWWGNSHGISNENSETERFLRTMVLSTSTPERLKKIVERDLSFLLPYVDVFVEVSIPTVNRVHIDIVLTDKQTGKTTETTYIWDSLMRDFERANDDEDLDASVSGLDYILEFNI